MTISTTPTDRTSTSFRAMGTDVEMTVLDACTERARRALSDARRELDRLAAIFTRFDACSELSLLNAARTAQCSPELVEVTQLALDARADTAGRFDPTTLRALFAAGYDADFEQVQRRSISVGTTQRGGHRPGTVQIDAMTGRISLGGDCMLDLGGIAKGWIADRVAALLRVCGPALVNAGGDIAVTERDDGDPWTVTLATPDGELVVGVERGGVATSGIDRRWWMGADGTRLHHVIDPSTGAPSRTDLVRVTVFDDSGCAAAEVDATRLLLAGRYDAIREATALGITAVLIDADDSVIRTGALA